MTYPWQGAQSPQSAGIIEEVAGQLNCEPNVLRAVWSVESGGRYFNKSGVIHRFEPHHMPDSNLTWRDSLKIGRTKRESLFMSAYAKASDSALRAASWGAPQIMGFNCKKSGYPTATAMVQAMAYSADNQIRIFGAFVTSSGLATHLRSKDWAAFARGYNGSGQVAVYSARLEKAYRRHSGKASEVVLKMGSTGAAVKTLQKLLHIKADGYFGTSTRDSVKAFQRQEGLSQDGIVGAKTWAALRLPEPPAKKQNWLAVLLAAITQMFGGKK